jgi:hypothetical protein
MPGRPGGDVPVDVLADPDEGLGEELLRRLLE